LERLMKARSLSREGHQQERKARKNMGTLVGPLNEGEIAVFNRGKRGGELWRKKRHTRGDIGAKRFCRDNVWGASKASREGEGLPGEQREGEERWCWVELVFLPAEKKFSRGGVFKKAGGGEEESTKGGVFSLRWIKKRGRKKKINGVRTAEGASQATKT